MLTLKVFPLLTGAPHPLITAVKDTTFSKKEENDYIERTAVTGSCFILQNRHKPVVKDTTFSKKEENDYIQRTAVTGSCFIIQNRHKPVNDNTRTLDVLQE